MLAAAAFVLAAPDFGSTLTVTNRTEMRVRATEGAPPPSPSLDLVEMPSFRLDSTDRRWRLSLGYTAMALLPDAEVGLSPQFTQVGDAGIAWQSRHATVRLTESAQYGEQNSEYLLGGGPTPPAAPNQPVVLAPAGTGVQALPAPATIQYGSSDTMLSGDYVFSPRWKGSLLFDYLLRGGLDDASRAIVPFVHGPRGEATLGHSVTRVDTIDTRISALHSDASPQICQGVITTPTVNDICSPTVEEGTLEEAWRHRLTRTGELSLGGGAALVAERLRPQDQMLDRLYPLARASFVDTRGLPPQSRRLSADLALAPVLDIRTGILDERAQATVAAMLPHGRWSYSGNLSFARSLESLFVQPVTFLTATAQFEYLVDRIVGVGGGALGTWSEQTGAGAFFGGMIFAQVTVHVPTIRF